jgi:transposase-like protein
MKEHYRAFVDNNPIVKISEPSFKKYVSEIDAIKLKKRFEQLLTKGEIKPDKDRFLKELIEDDNISNQKRKEIIAVFPELQQEQKEIDKEISLFNNLDKFGKNFLVMFLVACGLNYQVLSMLLGVSKGTIHNLFYSLTFIKRLILNSIKWWSGEISTDEKWIKLGKKWVYVISIVDNKTGFPLYFQLVSDLTSATWKIFFHGFYKIYGNPRIIISDGSGAIADAIKEVFPRSNHQLCKFHKLKNLMDKIYKSQCSSRDKERMIKLAKGIFANKSYYGRKRAAKLLIDISPNYISKYVEASILSQWKQLTKGFTSNSAERWNRKIKKVTLGRYGLKSEKFILQLITALWLKEAINNKIHFEKCFIYDIDMKKICQENMKMCNIIDFFKDKLLKKVA